MGASGILARVKAAQQRVQMLQQQVSPLHTAPETFTVLLEELGTALDELAASEEELLRKNEELAATRQAVEAERQRYQELFDFAPGGYLLTDVTGVVQEANRTATKLLHMRRENLIGRPLIVFVNEADRRTFYCQLSCVLQTDMVQEWSMRLQHQRHGIFFDAALTAAAVRDDAGRPVAVRWMLRDITQHQQAEAALRESEERYRRIVEMANEGIWAINGEAQTTYVNQRMAEMLGYSVEEMLNRSAFDFVEQEEWDRASQEWGGQQGIGSRLELRLLRKDASYLWVYGHVTPLFDENSHCFRGAFGMFTDMTAHKQAEADRQHLMERLVTAQEEERSRIARELHDQMGQHLTGLGLGLAVLCNQSPCPPEIVERIRQLQEYTVDIAKQMRHLAWELRPIELEDSGLHAPLQKYLEEWSQRSHIEVDFHSRGFDAPGTLAPHLEITIYRIVQEALTNIIKHAGAQHVSVLVERRCDHALAIVEDDGRGFDSSLEAQSSTPRHSLGLLGMQERAATVGGTLTVESTPGAGTAVFLRIPLNNAGGPDGGR